VSRRLHLPEVTFLSGDLILRPVTLETIISEIRSHPGVTRKHSISSVLGFFPDVGDAKVLASYGEDTAVLEFDHDDVLLFAVDGIMESLMKTNPFYAGYYSILANINDISAMGGVPIAMVDVISMKNEKICVQVMKGLESAVRKFGVPIVGGHTHPDCHYDAIDVSILGRARKDSVIYSDTARVGDDIIFAMDLDGYFPDKLPFAWDTTSKKDATLVRKQMLVMNEIGTHHLVHAGKDMSNPGSVGTLGMLLETSGKGGTVDLDLVPRPADQDFVQWLKAYQGCGFVVTSAPSKSPEVIEMFAQVGVTAAVVGTVDDSRILRLKRGKESGVLFDFSNEIITGCDPAKVPSRPG
jgi:putative methanogenesis marker protein 2